MCPFLFFDISHQTLMERAHLDKRNSVVVLPGSEPRAAGWNVLQIKLNHVALIIKRSYDIVDCILASTL